jgi:hypothetical protein
MMLVGVLSLTTVAAQVWKDIEEHNRRIEEAAQYNALLGSLKENIGKTERVLAEARRLAEPIKDVHATIFITVPLSDPGLANYRQRIAAGWPPSPPMSPPGTHQLRLGMEPPRAELAVYGARLSSRSATGKIAAVTDLVGCQLLLKISHVAGASDAELNKRANTIGRTSTFPGIVLDVRGSVRLSIPATSLRRHTDPFDGMPFYVFTFPDTEQALRALQPKG